MRIKKVGKVKNEEIPIQKEINDQSVGKEPVNYFNDKDPLPESKSKIDLFKGNRLLLIILIGIMIIAGGVYYFAIYDSSSTLKTISSSDELKLKELELKERELKLREQALNEKKSGQFNTQMSSSGSDTELSDIAVNQVQSWITSLGNGSFRTAYSLMSPRIRGEYSKFSSTKAYGGITGTTIFNCYVDSKAGCKYEVLADYEAIDPYNKSGRYIQKFSVENCDGSWMITQIKNISITNY